MPTTFTLSVPDMSCGHCRASIEGALHPLGAQLQFDMDRRRVTVSGEIATETAIAALDDVGFDATPAP